LREKGQTADFILFDIYAVLNPVAVPGASRWISAS
jgi:hypothetical protein